VRTNERAVRKLAGTVKRHGTQEHGIKQAIERLGLSFSELKCPALLPAFDWLLEAAAEGKAGIICVERGEHWNSVIGACGENLIVADPKKSKSNRKENGIHVFTRTNARRYWSPFEGSFYALTVTK
jgi:ABC-type bacteriocin/lantibiotic exporter with double-glycine peptidase domain